MAKPLYDLRHLTWFERTVAMGNITRAATSLNMSQPTLSKALRRLEEQVGAPLLIREPTGIRPTPLGERLVRHARLIRTQVSEAMDDVREAGEGRTGRIRIGAGPSWVRRLLPDAAATLLRDRPGLALDVAGGFDESLLRLLADGELDLVLAERPIDENDRSPFDFTPLSSDHLVVCGRREHPIAEGRVEASAALAARWALPPAHTLARRKLDGRAISLGLAPPVAAVTSASLAFLSGVAMRSDLLLYTTRSIMSEAGGRLQEIDAPSLVTKREAGLIVRRPTLLTPAMGALIDALVNACAADPVN